MKILLQLLLRGAIGLLVLLLSFNLTFGQTGWTKNQIANSQTFVKFCAYVDNKNVESLPLDTLFKNYIYFDYILKDTVTGRKEKRLEIFPKVLQRLQHVVDSIGAENIEAKPISFFEGHAELYKPFTRQLKEEIPNVLAYYKKGHENSPIGTILFDPKTHKIVAWIMIDQGGYYYYMTFNLI